MKKIMEVGKYYRIRQSGSQAYCFRCDKEDSSCASGPLIGIEASEIFYEKYHDLGLSTLSLIEEASPDIIHWMDQCLLAGEHIRKPVREVINNFPIY